MGKVIVFGTGVVAYGVIDESAKAGLEVIHLTTKTDDIAALSRLISEKHVVTFSGGSNSHLLELLMRKSVDWSGALLVPVNDQYVVFVSKHFDKLSRHYECTVQPWEVYSEIINKNKLYAHAYKIGVPAPQIQCPVTINDLDQYEGRLAFPCILKPYQTPEFYKVFNQKVHVVNNHDELKQKFREVKKHRLDVMVSEIIPGPESDQFIYISCLDANGDVLAEMFTRKIRQDREFGVASVLKTVEANDQIRDMSLRLLRHFCYRGFSALEVKLDERDGIFKLIEINTRPVLYQRLFVKAGINFSHLVYANYVEGKAPDKVTYSRDVYWIHNISELYKLKRSMRSSELTLSDFFYPYRQRHVFALPFPSDPKPLLRMLWKHSLHSLKGRFVREEISQIYRSA